MVRVLMLARAIILPLCGHSLSSGLRLADDADAITRPALQAKSLTKPVIDMVLFNGEQDMFTVRANELATVVDLFLVFEGNCTFTGKHKDMSFSQTDARISHLNIQYVQVPCFSASNAWDNEASTRMYMQEHLQSGPWIYKILGHKWVHGGAVIASDVDEVPMAEKLKELFRMDDFWQSLESGSVYRVRGPTFYYNTRCALTDRSAQNWKGARLISSKLMNGLQAFGDWRSRQVLTDKLFEEKLLFEDGDQQNDDAVGTNILIKDLVNYGWHFSYFLDANSISKKITTFSHTEYAKPPFTDLSHIQHHQENCIDPFDRHMPEFKVPEGWNGTMAVPVLPEWMKKAAMDGRLPKWYMTGSYH